MYTIKDNSIYELVIKNSKFITVLYKVSNISDIENKLNDIRNEYPDATHYCYGYIVDDIKKASDDGEPSGTAGIPIMKVLESNSLTNILCIVIRYFGGIKLGANGLIRAYTKSVANAIKETQINRLIDGINIDIVFPYDMVKDVDYLLKDCKINNKSFDKEITYNVDVLPAILETIKNKNIDYQIIKNIKIEE